MLSSVDKITQIMREISRERRESQRGLLPRPSMHSLVVLCRALTQVLPATSAHWDSTVTLRHPARVGAVSCGCFVSSETACTFPFQS